MTTCAVLKYQNLNSISLPCDYVSSIDTTSPVSTLTLNPLTLAVITRKGGNNLVVVNLGNGCELVCYCVNNGMYSMQGINNSIKGSDVIQLIKKYTNSGINNYDYDLEVVDLYTLNPSFKIIKQSGLNPDIAVKFTEYMSNYSSYTHHYDNVIITEGTPETVSGTTEASGTAGFLVCIAVIFVMAVIGVLLNRGVNSHVVHEPGYYVNSPVYVRPINIHRGFSHSFRPSRSSSSSSSSSSRPSVKVTSRAR